MNRISTRLLGALCALFFCVASLSIIAWRSMAEQVEALNHMYTEHVVAIRNLKVISDRLAIDVVDATHKVNATTMKIEEGYATVHKAVAETEALWKAYRARTMLDDERKLVEETAKPLSEALAAANRVEAMMKSKDRMSISGFAASEMYPAIDPGTGKISDLIEYHLKISQKHYEDIRDVQSSANTKLALVSILALGLALLTGGYVYLSVSRSLKAQIATMNTMAAGNLEAEVHGEARKDEVGDIARALVSFREAGLERLRLQDAARREEQERVQRAERIETAVREFEAAAFGIVNSVSASAEDLSNASARMLDISATTNEQTTRVAAASTEVSQSMVSLASAGEQLASSINEIGRQAEQSSSYASAAAAKARTTDDTVKKLNHTGHAIAEVIDLIKSIASQTNLLALNATIEAARAGESGRGFAVVASEVKALAAQTTHATDVIAEHVSAIQEAATESMTAMSDISRMVAEINQVASSIAVAVTEQSQATAGISENVQQVARGTEETTQTITVVSSVAADTSQAAASVRDASETLNMQSQLMREKVEDFLRTVRAA